MKMNKCIQFGLIALLCYSGRLFAGDFDATTQTVGHTSGGLETPVNQLVTPAGKQVELPGMRPNALALSPDSKCLVTSGLKSELIVVDPGTGKILQHVPMPSDQQLPATAAIASTILSPNESDKLSFTGLTFSPDA